MVILVLKHKVSVGAAGGLRTGQRYDDVTGLLVVGLYEDKKMVSDFEEQLEQKLN